MEAYRVLNNETNGLIGFIYYKNEWWYFKSFYTGIRDNANATLEAIKKEIEVDYMSYTYEEVTGCVYFPECQEDECLCERFFEAERAEITEDRS